MSKCKDKKNQNKQLEFDVILSFYQELREDPPIGFVPASNTIADPHVKGKAYFLFSEDFHTLDIKMNIYGNLTGDRAITLAHLHLDEADKTGPLTVSLYPNPNAIVKTKKDKFTIKIRLTNDDIVPRSNGTYQTNTINSLYNAILGNSLYIDAHGSGDYLLGMIRGQIYLLY